ncbi:alpha/beta fold hydrolase [Paeniglutamicibacter cryotolerans]|uniref:Pimeloyl-ACP methyl ester carboxylesterase n=1 Tax=Paeniglutamicibacter cryotolerans TaxID=670079 RepID=A0A839QLR0_9MICC|nr:alpha/beta fold hydrolase [Paeniglutamicibacter cryotolerans]MBB2996720.1 pimeloyl-ACP methyl ester carboxylesterase [Paeniglutamicibacter cryotolerans]
MSTVPDLPSAPNPARAAQWRWGLLGLGAGAVAGSIVAVGASGLAGYFARRIVTPDVVPGADLDILAVITTGEGTEIILPANESTTVEGRYSLFFDADRGHARLGDITSFDPVDRTVTRSVEEVYSGDLNSAVRGRLSGVVFHHPRDLGFEARDVEILQPGGSAPAWLVPGGERASTWAIAVHGRGANRLETLRGLPVLHELGLTSLLISYRNDGEAPAAIDGRYGLGATEWPDVEAAIDFALEHGAIDIVLVGWSMGGAISLQVADKSRHAPLLRALVLDGPVVNWIDVLAHQARVNRIPEAVGRFGQWMISNRAGRWLTGMASPLDLREMNWVAKHDRLRVPTLILHSADDDFVPIGPSAQLAELNPDVVTFERFTRAGHTREWNVDPQRWERTVSRWLTGVLNAPRPGGSEQPVQSG